MEVCPKCQNSFPAYQMFAHNLECEMPLPIQDLESKCDFCQLDFSNHLLEEHLSQCEAKHQIDFQAKAQQDQLQQIQSQQYTQPLQNTNQQNILEANMKQESERNNVVQQVPRKKKIIIKEVEYQTPLEEQRKFQQNQQQQEWQKYRQQKQQQIYQQQRYQIQEQQQMQPQQLQRNQYQQCQQEHCQYQMQQQQFQQEQYQYQMQQQQQYQYQMQQQQQYQYQMQQQQQYQYQMEQQQQQQLQQQQQIIFQPSVVQQLQKSLELIYQQKQQQQQQQPQITCIGFQNQPLQQSQPYKQYNQPVIQQSVGAIQPQSVSLKKQKKNKAIGIKDFSNWSVYYFKRSPVLDESYLSCVICLLDYQEDDNIVLLQCTHRFHEKCLIEWSNKNSSCPLCNLDVL